MTVEIRYSRQMRLQGFGEAGQARLRTAKVAVVGLGATGSVIADWLARAGVGSLSLLDRDVVELSNLQRQGLYIEADVGRSKAEAAHERLAAIGGTHLESAAVELTAANAAEWLDGADLIVDGSDNFETRLLINDWTKRAGRPWVYSGVVGQEGQSALFFPEDACLRCFLGDLPPPGSLPTCDTAGVLGPAVGVVASLSAAKALRALLGIDAPGRVFLDQIRLDALPTRRLEIPPDPACRACQGQLDFLDRPPALESSRLCGRDAVQVRGQAIAGDLTEIAHQWRAAGYPAKASGYLIRVQAFGMQLSVFADGRMLAQGCSEPAKAEAAYRRLLGS